MADVIQALVIIVVVICTSQAKEPTETCDQPLGMESGKIPDADITASSMYGQTHSPARARLYAVKEGKLTGAWVARYKDQNQWIQVKFGELKNVTRIATQGRNRYSQWVTSYSLNYSTDGQAFMSYNNGEILEGNDDRNSVVLHYLDPPMQGKYFRLIPKTWKHHIALRMELYGCRAFPSTNSSASSLSNTSLLQLPSLHLCFYCVMAILYFCMHTII